jgi:uncharacterized Zn finger protein (UPF0148 family)
METYQGFCQCGLPKYIKDGKPLCPKHGDKPPEKKTRRGRFSGKSKSENRFNDYA